MYIYISPNLPIHPIPTSLRGNHSLHLWLYFFFARSFFFTIFLDSTCKQYLFFSLWLTSLCLTVTRFIHISANGAISLIFHHIYVPHKHIQFKGAQACIYAVCQKGHWNNFQSCSDNYEYYHLSLQKMVEQVSMFHQLSITFLHPFL